MEEQVIGEFRDVFMESTLPEMARQQLSRLAIKRAIKNEEDEDVAKGKVEKEFASLGEFAFSFDSATSPALKQMRHMLLMAGCGSVNMEIDEIGANLVNNTDVLTTCLELYDVGKVKQKLTKNTVESTRSEEIIGKTPTNLMLFGTPSKLLDGGKIEHEFDGFLEMGYARRCFFGYTEEEASVTDLTVDEIYARAGDRTADTFLCTLSNDLAQLADLNNFGKTLYMVEAASKLVIEYKLDCEVRAAKLRASETTRKAEMAHRYFKMTKLAGAYAFIEGSPEITEEHLYQAMKLTEESGDAFNTMLTRDRNYVKLAKFIATSDEELTNVDLVEALPFYKGSEVAKRELMNLAIAWGHRNHMVIKKSFIDGIEFLKGESLAVTDLSKVIVSYSSKLAADYEPKEFPFSSLSSLTKMTGRHWTNHKMLDNHRKEENSIPGFNLVVIDVDEGVSIETAQYLMKDYTYHIYTTKRHQIEGHGDRFRLVLPMSHTLRMGAEEYKEFMNNIYDWLPFDCDKATNQRCKKWMTHAGVQFDNEGQLLDTLLFIPKTARSDEQRKNIDSMQSLSNVERWFMSNTGKGNRSNQLIKFAMMLVDSGQDFAAIRMNVLSLNSKLSEPMKENEIDATIMQTAAKALAKK